jgi:nitroimidazol reductase NimA-like FMN-containing flavoprotein (pyridoxamine 5'-phosphate oxidase superfamily)
MRRTDKELTDRLAIDAVIRGSLYCHVAFADGDIPYVLPLSFGYDGSALYFHTAKTGKKIDCISANPRVCFAMECGVELISGGSNPCKWTFSFNSVVGDGLVTELRTLEEKAHGLNQIMLHYSQAEWQFDSASLASTRVWRIEIRSISGKTSEHKAT